tara:strand:- start:3827 stop:4126 length:300 start_codon:yes stop_codon:yes gene_type:complete
MATAAQQREEAAKRLDRIEEKIDKMSEAIISLARAEEKIMSMEKFLHQQADLLGDLTKRIGEVESKVSSNATTVGVINKMFWIVIAGAATAITGMLLMQ